MITNVVIKCGVPICPLYFACVTCMLDANFAFMGINKMKLKNNEISSMFQHSGQHDFVMLNFAPKSEMACNTSPLSWSRLRGIMGMCPTLFSTVFHTIQFSR